MIYKDSIKYYGYIYVVIDLVNRHNLPNPFYVGQKKGKFNRNYYGSGKLIKNAVNKYGKCGFKLKPVDCAFSQKELDELEMAWIKDLDCKRPKGYNLTDGGLTMVGYIPTKEKKQQQSKQISGRVHIYNIKTNKSKMVRGIEINQYLSRGWVLGRNKEIQESNKIANTGKRYIYNKQLNKEKLVNPEFVDEYLVKGWMLCRRPNIGLLTASSQLGRIQIYNNKLNKIKSIPSDQVSEYLSRGWVLRKDLKGLYHCKKVVS